MERGNIVIIIIMFWIWNEMYVLVVVHNVQQE